MTPRARRSAPSTASARGCCASTRSARASTPTSRSSTRPSRGVCAWLAFRRALAALLAGERREEAVELLAAYGADRVQRMIWAVYAEQRSRGVSLPGAARPARLPARARARLRAERLASPPDSSRRAPAARRRWSSRRPARARCWARCWSVAGDAYAELKQRALRRALDFDDLELCARELLERHEGVRRVWTERIELLMVDEFQDTNRRQLALLELLERDNLFTVGDELQSIYGFRHAEVEIFRERHRALRAAGAAIALAHNFRGRPAADRRRQRRLRGALRGCLHPAARRARGPHQDGPADRAAAHRQERLGALASRSAHRRGAAARDPLASAAEARLLAQRVAELVGRRAGRGGRCGGTAARRDRPARVRAGPGGARPAHARRGGQLLGPPAGRRPAGVAARARQPPGRARALLRARLPARGDLQRRPRAARAAEPAPPAPARGRRSHTPRASCITRLSAPRPRASRALRRALCRRASRRRRRCGAAELLLRAIARSGYEQHVLSLPWGERRLGEHPQAAAPRPPLRDRGGRDLRGFLDHVAHRRALSESSEPHAPTGSEPDAVRLMTIHAAKGLEFPVVCLADLGRNGNGTPPDLLVDGERVGLRLVAPRRLPTGGVPALRGALRGAPPRRGGRGGADPSTSR